MRRVAVLALVVVLVTAGCAAPVPSDSQVGPTTGGPATTETTATGENSSTADSGSTSMTTSTANDDDTTWNGSDAIEVRNGPLSVNASLTFHRLTTLLETDVDPPATIQVQPNDAMTTEARGLPRFARTMGIGDADGSREVATAGLTQGADYVALNARLVNDEDRARGVLVHEFVHVVQFRQGSIETTYRNIRPGSTDSQMTYLAIVEGVPVYVEDQYAMEYGEGEPTGMDDIIRGYRRGHGVQKYALAPYAFGAMYAAERAGSASNVSALYEHPPNTTEAIIHGYKPGEEPARTLRLRVETRGTDWRWTDRDRLGELFVRQVLDTELDRDRAATAAAGWGVDRQLTFEHETQTGYVWALRWDSTRDATEFEDATRAYLDDRGTSRNGVWRADETTFDIRRPSPEVVVIVAGPEHFTTQTAVSGTNSSVTVEPGTAA